MKKQLVLGTGICLTLLLSSCGGSQKLAKASAPHRDDRTPDYELHSDSKEGNWVVPDASVTRASEDDEFLSLDKFIDDWYGTPHVMGGNTKNGVDCSGFVIQAYLQVFDQNFRGRRAEDLFSETEVIKRKELQYGDLVFFKISGRRIDHVGIYLQDDEFVHVSSSKGVMISRLSNPYFDRRFFKGGRKRAR